MAFTVAPPRSVAPDLGDRQALAAAATIGEEPGVPDQLAVASPVTAPEEVPGELAPMPDDRGGTPDLPTSAVPLFEDPPQPSFEWIADAYAPEGFGPAAGLPVRTDLVRAMAISTLSGKVTKAADNSNVAGASVTLVGGTAAPATTTTDANGNYAFNGVSDGSYRLMFVPPANAGLATRWNGGAASFAAAAAVSVAADTAVNISLPAGFNITGTVTAATGGAAAAGVGVFVYDASAACCSPIVARIVAGANGVYRAPVVGAGATYKVRFVPDAATSDLLSEWYDDKPSLVIDPTAFAAATTVTVTNANVTANAALATGFRISGTLRNAADNSALGNGFVSAFTGGAGSLCCTSVGGGPSDASGAFAIVVPNGTYRLRASGPFGSAAVARYYPAAATFNAAADIVVNGAAVTGRDMSLVAGIFIRGTVTQTGGGAVANASVSANAGGAGAQCCVHVNGTSTNATGVFALAVPSGTYRLRINAPQGSTLVSHWYPNQARFDLATDVVVGTTEVTGITAQLVAGFSVSGTVRKADNSAVAGVNVNVNLGGSAICCTFVAGAQTAANGTYAITVPNGTYKVSFNPSGASGLTAQWHQNKTRFDLASDVVVNGGNVANVDATLAGGFAVSGLVTDASGGGIRGVNVHASDATKPCCVGLGNASTDEEGAYSLVLPNGSYRLRFNPPASGSFVPEYYDDKLRGELATTVVVNNAAVPGRNATLASGVRIRGRVTNAAGAALEGINVSAYLGGASAVCCTWVQGINTDATGAYALVVPAGTYRIQFFPRTGNYATTWYGGTSRFELARDVTATADVSGIDAGLVTGFRISGTVVDGANAPLLDIGVSAFVGGAEAFCCTWLAGTSTNGAGQYSLVVPQGTYRIQFYPRAAGLLPRWWDAAARFDQATDLAVLANVANVNATIAAGSTISGTVTSGGVGVEGVSVDAFIGGANAVCCTYLAGTRTRPDGTYALAIPNGTYRINFTPRASAHVQQWHSGVTRFETATDVAVNGNVANLNAALVAGGRITGTVTDRTSGAPIQGVGVGAFVGGANAICCTWLAGAGTDAAGAYSLVVPAGTYRIQFFPRPGWTLAGGQRFDYVQQWLGGGWHFAQTDDIAVGGGTVSLGAATLARGSRIAGAVTAQQGGAAIAGVHVSAIGSAFAFGGPPTDGFGNFAVVVPNGTYRLRLNAPAGSVYISEYWNNVPQLQAAREIVVNGAAVTGINAALRTGRRISGTVRGPGGAAVEGVHVHAFFGGADAKCQPCPPPGFSGRTRADGTYELRVPSGPYRVQFWPQPTQQLIPEFWNDVRRLEQGTDIVVGNADVAGIDAVLAGGLRINGTLRDSAGNGVPFVHVGAMVSGAGAKCCEHINGAQTDGAGFYSVIVPNGTYRLMLSPSPKSGDFVQRWYGDVSRYETARDVTVAGANVNGIDATLARGQRLSGRVRGGGGAATDGVFVAAFAGGLSAQCCTFVGGTVVQQDGTWQLLLEPGTYRLFFSSNAGATVPQWYLGAARFDLARDLQLPATSGIGGLDVTLDRGARISGLVTNAAGTPLADVGVSAYVGGTACCTWIAGARTDGSGTYSLVVPDGTYKVRFYPRTAGLIPEWYDDQSRFDRARDLVIRNQNVAGVNASIAAGFVIRGTVRNAAGIGLDKIAVNAFLGGAGATCCTWAAGAVTTSAGDYAFTVPNGTYRIWFFDRSRAHDPRWYDAKPGFTTANDVVVSGADVAGRDGVLAPAAVAAGIVEQANLIRTLGLDAEFLGESAFPSVQPGEGAALTVFFRNTGATAWVKGTYTQVDLLACRDDKVTCDVEPEEPEWNPGTWLSPTRYATQEQSVVLPGHIATFTFRVNVPLVAAAGTYRFTGELGLSSLAGSAARIHPVGYYQEVLLVTDAKGIRRPVPTPTPYLSPIVEVISAPARTPTPVSTDPNEAPMSVPLEAPDTTLTVDAAADAPPDVAPEDAPSAPPDQ